MICFEDTEFWVVRAWVEVQLHWKGEPEAWGRSLKKTVVSLFTREPVPLGSSNDQLSVAKPAVSTPESLRAEGHSKEIIWSAFFRQMRKLRLRRENLLSSYLEVE